MTFSLAARCARSGQFAAMVTSSSPAVAARCAYAQAGVGAVTTQNITDPRLGPAALKLLQAGHSAPDAMEALKAAAGYLQYRQMTIIDSAGRTAVFSGAHTLGIHGQAQGRDGVSAGNLLANSEIPAAIIAAFEATDSALELGQRVITAMQAGLTAGGEAGPIKSAGLVLVESQAWPLADLRVDWHDKPLEEMAALWSVWQPQMRDYVTRALNPAGAPSFGVPGDQ